MTTTVFVYGTLMPGERNAHIAARGGPFTAQPATLRAHRLHHLHPEAYPALTPGHPDDLVRGYALTYTPDAWSAALPFLDELEGAGDLIRTEAEQAHWAERLAPLFDALPPAPRPESAA